MTRVCASPVRWGMLGCGNVAETKSGPALKRAERSTLMAVMSRRGDRAQDYARRHGAARWYDDAAALIADPDVDAVYIATPPDSHCEYALACARAGKAAYVEKPMGRTHDECVRMNRAFEAAGLPLFVAYYRRALPRFCAVKELVDGGAIGVPRFVRVTLTRPVADAERDVDHLPWRVVPEVSGGGRFVDLGSHALDFLDWVLGPIAEATGVASNQAALYLAEDTVSCALRFGSGAVGSGVFCFLAQSSVDVVEISGDKGTLEVSLFADGPVRLTTSRGVEERFIAQPAHVQQPLIQMVVDDLCGLGRCPSTGQTAARTSYVIDRILQGYRQLANPTRPA